MAGVMPVLARRITTLGVAMAMAMTLVAAGTAGSPVNQSSLPTIYFLYSMNCTFTVQNDAGQTITQIPPGQYEVDVRTPIPFGTVPMVGVAATDMTACHGSPQFQLTGPGVSLFTTMTAGCESDKTFPETFQADGTYVAQDLNQPSVTRTSFTI